MNKQPPKATLLTLVYLPFSQGHGLNFLLLRWAVGSPHCGHESVVSATFCQNWAIQQGASQHPQSAWGLGVLWQRPQLHDHNELIQELTSEEGNSLPWGNLFQQNNQFYAGLVCWTGTRNAPLRIMVRVGVGSSAEQRVRKARAREQGKGTNPTPFSSTALSH